MENVSDRLVSPESILSLKEIEYQALD